MSQQDFVYIDSDVDCEDEDALADFFEDAYESGLLSEAMDLDPDPTDPRLNTDKVEITSVTFFKDSSSIRIEYEVVASCYYGCADQNREVNFENAIEGLLENGVWKFPRHIKQAPRTTHEEY